MVGAQHRREEIAAIRLGGQQSVRAVARPGGYMAVVELVRCLQVHVRPTGNYDRPLPKQVEIVVRWYIQYLLGAAPVEFVTE